MSLFFCIGMYCIFRTIRRTFSHKTGGWKVCVSYGVKKTDYIFLFSSPKKLVRLMERCVLWSEKYGICFQSVGHSPPNICWSILVRIYTDLVSVTWNSSITIPSSLATYFFLVLLEQHSLYFLKLNILHHRVPLKKEFIILVSLLYVFSTPLPPLLYFHQVR